MTSDDDPFTHHPELRNKIVDPLTSSYRDMDLATLDEKMMAAGGPADWRHSDAYREESRRKTLERRPQGDLWIFAYGSLIWDPAFRFSEVRTALLKGYRRSFCLKSELGRGTPEKPGLMAGLDDGGACRGIVFRIDRDHIDVETRVIWRREMLLHAYAPKFVQVETPPGNVEALAFVIDHSAKSYLPGLSMEETAGYMATGSGIFGSSLAYIESLAGHFETIGIEDEALFRLLDLSRRMATD
jgi:cation transport protein ChaC